MTPEELILMELPDTEARSTIKTFPEDWVADLDYEFVEEHADQVSQFFARVIPKLPPAEAFTLAVDCQSHYLLGLAHLDARDVAARLLIGSIKRLLNSVAEVLEGTEHLADGPDAGVSQQTYRRFTAAAEQLRRIDLSIEAPEDS